MLLRLAALSGALALVAAGCGGTTEGSGAGGAEFVPGTAVAFLAIDTDPDSSQWQQALKLADKFPDKDEAVDELKKSLRDETALDYERDVRPALGEELDFVWLDLENDGENFVLLTQPADEGKFRQVIATANAKEKDPADRVVYETFKGWKLLANKRATIKRFRQASNAAETTLAQEPSFKRSMKRLGDEGLMRAFVAGEPLMRLARKSGGADAASLIDKAGVLDWIALKLAATEDGIGLDTVVHGTPGKLFKGIPLPEEFSPDLTKSTPEDALLYWTFHGSKNMFQGLRKNALLDTPEFREYAPTLEKIGTLLQGENAIYVRPGSGHSPDIPFNVPEVTFVAQPGGKSDPAATLDRLLNRELSIAPDRKTIAGWPVRKLGNGEVAGYYANVDGKLVITDLPSGIRGVAGSGKSLADAEAYRDAVDASGLPGKTHGFIYVNVDTGIPLVEKLSGERLPTKVARNLKPLRSAVEYAASRSHELKVTLFLRIK